MWHYWSCSYSTSVTSLIPPVACNHIVQRFNIQTCSSIELEMPIIDALIAMCKYLTWEKTEIGRARGEHTASCFSPSALGTKWSRRVTRGTIYTNDICRLLRNHCIAWDIECPRGILTGHRVKVFMSAVSPPLKVLAGPLASAEKLLRKI